MAALYRKDPRYMSIEDLKLGYSLSQDTEVIDYFIDLMLDRAFPPGQE